MDSDARVNGGPSSLTRAMQRKADEANAAAAPLIAHIVFSLEVGGLENNLINLINHMPDRYRHVVICLSHFTDFRTRIRRANVRVLALHKRPGKDFGAYLRLWRLLRHIRPDIVNTNNYGTLDATLVAVLAGVPCRIHSEHGWDMTDLHGDRFKYKLLRRGLSPLIQRYVPVSEDSDLWLKESVGIPGERVSAICNGVDTNAFQPAVDGKPGLMAKAGAEFGPGKFVVGTIGRLDAVKDQMTLVKAFSRLVRERPVLADRLRLVIIGNGPLEGELRAALEQENLSSMSWLPGSRDDIAELLRGMDLFVLPSLNEGIPITILEAMASGLPVIATRVGGNPELVVDGGTGRLIPASDPVALARAIEGYAADPEKVLAAGCAGRKRAEERFSLNAMVAAYTRLYDELIKADR